MRSRGPLPIVCLTVAPWSALGALLHGFVLTLAVVPVLAFLLRPSPAGVLALFGATQVALTLVVYRLVAPDGLRPRRAKFMSVVTVFSGLVAVFCAGLAWYWFLNVREDAVFGVTGGVLALLALVAYLVALGASIDAIVAGVDDE